MGKSPPSERGEHRRGRPGPITGTFYCAVCQRLVDVVYHSDCPGEPKGGARGR